MPEILIALAPLIALLGALLLGRYPGCDAIVRIAERHSTLAARARPGRQSPPRPRRDCFPAGGLRIAFGLAQRPPPLPV